MHLIRNECIIEIMHLITNDYIIKNKKARPAIEALSTNIHCFKMIKETLLRYMYMFISN